MIGSHFPCNGAQGSFWDKYKCPDTELVKPELLRSRSISQESQSNMSLESSGSICVRSSNWHQREPSGPSPKGLAAGKAALEEIHLYPDGGCYELINALAKGQGLQANQLIVGNGSNEILELIGHAFIGQGDEVVIGQGSFIVYKLVTLLFGGKVVEVPTKDYRHDLRAMLDRIGSDEGRISSKPGQPERVGKCESGNH